MVVGWSSTLNLFHFAVSCTYFATRNLSGWVNIFLLVVILSTKVLGRKQRCLGIWPFYLSCNLLYFENNPKLTNDYHWKGWIASFSGLIFAPKIVSLSRRLVILMVWYIYFMFVVFAFFISLFILIFMQDSTHCTYTGDGIDVLLLWVVIPLTMAMWKERTIFLWIISVLSMMEKAQ